MSLNAAGLLLTRLKHVGVDYIFANSGTDFPPVIEGLAAAEAAGLELPQALVMPHEHAAMGMAYGYFLATGRPQAVMAHTNVGLANCAIGAINMATERIPVLLFSGRTPVVEEGRFGARTVPIGWGQEMRDQTALVREAVKWDYELRFPEQAAALVDRAYAIAMSTPKGPVYLSLPREVLCEQVTSDADMAQPAMAPARAGINAGAIEQATALLATARNPVIVAQRGTGSEAAFAAFSRMVEQWAIPVVQYWAIQLALPTDHPMHAGIDPAPWLTEADVVLVLDCLAPWSPQIHPLRPDCTVIQAGPDPLHQRFAFRNFRTDLALAGETDDLVLALERAMQQQPIAQDAMTARRARISTQTSKSRSTLLAKARAGSGPVMTKDYVSLCLSEAVAGKRARILSELGAPFAPLTLQEHGSWFQEPHSGGLGWSFPTALGLQLADRERLIVATMGDGSYMFANPTACHQIAEALDLPILLIILNNGEWGAVRQSVLGLYPDGQAAKANRMPMTSLSPSPDFTLVAKASRAYAEQVEDGKHLPDALARALQHIADKRTLALLDVRVAP